MKSVWLKSAVASAALLLSSWSTATVVNSTDVPVAICDLCSVTSTLNVGASGTISDVNVRINDLRHSWDADLRISISHGATTVILSDRNGGSADNYIGTVFDDEAATAVTAGAAPFTGSFRPDGLLSAFDGQDVLGLWTLRVEDLAGLDVGSINSWSLDFTANEQAVPEPASIALLGLGLLGLAASRRRRAS